MSPTTWQGMLQTAEAAAYVCAYLVALLRIPLLLWVSLLKAPLVGASIIPRLASEVALGSITLIAMMMIMMKKSADSNAVSLSTAQS